MSDNILPGSKWKINTTGALVIVVAVTNFQIFYSDINGLCANLSIKKFLVQHKPVLNQ